MNKKKAMEITENFNKFGSKGIIREYPKEELMTVLPELADIDREAGWYKEMLKYLYRKDEKWWQDPLLVGVTGAVIGSLITGAVSLYIFRAERQDQASEVAKSNNEIDRLRAKIRHAVSSKDPSELIDVMDEINNLKK